MRHMSRLVAALAVVMTPSAFADTTAYTSSASFLASLQAGSYTEAFTGTPGVFDSPLSFSGGGFSYQMSTPTTVVGLFRNGSVIGNSYEAETLTITIAGGATAIGGNFYLSNVSDAFQAEPVTVTLNDGTTSTFTPSAPGTGSYIGFTSTTPITTLVVSAPPLLRFNFADNVTVGVATPIPEASSFALMALGLGGLLLLRRRLGG